MAKKKAKKKAGARGKAAKRPAAKKTAKRKACGKKAACGQKKASAKSTAGSARRMQVGRKIVEMRTWRRIGRLADDALVALDDDKIKEARRIINSVRAVAMSADRG